MFFRADADGTNAGLLGILMGVSQLGLLSGPLIGGALTEYASWRWCTFRILLFPLQFQKNV